ncbi:unnamed protein product [Vitrella brassicaformis CCMP3155]|uniref:Uncharacterized protein n=1 Tax=Vitrella brassicaformis (strain CCMP3155) TaxID=1169540 RepID=A0A0G4GXD1_VITBC|nr:unnamed protein product [Vitrella brassicaformis CCMP3155]|eukprot:CEM35447.1 unnamed protein product [Vitrella brassicaformis CCMP3155]
MLRNGAHEQAGSQDIEWAKIRERFAGSRRPSFVFVNKSMSGHLVDAPTHLPADVFPPSPADLPPKKRSGRVSVVLPPEPDAMDTDEDVGAGAADKEGIDKEATRRGLKKRGKKPAAKRKKRGHRKEPTVSSLSISAFSESAVSSFSGD